MQALTFSVSIPQWLALAGFKEMIEINLNKERHRAMKTAVTFV